MSQHWRQPTNSDTLSPSIEFFVRVCGFTFWFSSVEQVRKTLAFYERKTHPSSRLPELDWVRQQAQKYPINYRECVASYIASHHDALQHWWTKLPLYLQKNGKRERVIKALERALRDFDPAGSLRTHCA
jgi:hypothetical protein